MDFYIVIVIKALKIIYKYVALDHKTSHKSHVYNCGNSQKYIVKSLLFILFIIFILCQKSLGY